MSCRAASSPTHLSYSRPVCRRPPTGEGKVLSGVNFAVKKGGIVFPGESFGVEPSRGTHAQGLESTSLRSCCFNELRIWALFLVHVLCGLLQSWGISRFQLWAFQGWRNFPLAKLSLGEIVPGRNCPLPCGVVLRPLMSVSFLL